VLTVADGTQQGFFDSAWCGDVVAEDSFYGLLSRHGHRIVNDRDLAPCYAERRGRPSVPPSHLAKILLLAYREGVSDEQAMERLRYDLRWKVAVGVPFDHRGYHPTTLVKFRARLLLHGLERLALTRSIELASELGLMQGAAEQIVDSTPMLGAAATQDTVRLVRGGVRKLIDAVAGVDAEAGERLGRGLGFDYARPGEKPECDWRSKPARERMLSEIAQDAERALRAVEAEPDLMGDDDVAEAHHLLRQIVGQDFEVDEHDVPRLRRGVAPGRILSVHDPEMRHGRKSSATVFDGYKIHVAGPADTPLIGAVEVSPGGDHDGHHAPALIDQQPKALRPGRILGDTAYGDQATREALAGRQVDVLAPVPEPPAQEDRLPKRAFAVDLQAATVTCPAGQVAPIPARAQRSGERVVRFAGAVCAACPLKARCCPGPSGRQVRLLRREDLAQAGRRALAEPEGREHLRRTRPRLERLLGLLAHRYHTRQCRYLGKRKALLQAAWSAVLVNLHPIGAALGATPA
jgi:transposase